MLNSKLKKAVNHNDDEIIYQTDKIININNLSQISSISTITNTIVQGDTLQTLKKMPSGQVE